MSVPRIILIILLLIIFNGCSNDRVTTTKAKKTEIIILVDGEIDSIWYESRWNIVSNITSGYRTVHKNDFFVKFKVLWDTENCYFLFKVKDDYKYIKPSFRSDIEKKYSLDCDGDGIQLFMSKNERGWKLENNVFKKYGFSYIDDTLKVGGMATSDKTKRNIRFKFKELNEGYLLEVSIPFEELELNPLQNEYMLLDILASDNDGDKYEPGANANTDNYLCWSVVNGFPYLSDTKLYGKVLFEK